MIVFKDENDSWKRCCGRFVKGATVIGDEVVEEENVGGEGYSRPRVSASGLQRRRMLHIRIRVA